MRQTFAPVFLVLALAACGGGKPDVISSRKFVAANVAVRAVSDSLPNAKALREAALKKEGVSARDLQAWLDAHARDPKKVAAAWEAIAKRVDRPGPNGSPPGGPPPSAMTIVPEVGENPDGDPPGAPGAVVDRTGRIPPVRFPEAGGPPRPPSAGGRPVSPGNADEVRKRMEEARRRRMQRGQPNAADSLPPVDQLNIRVRGDGGRRP